MGIQVNHYETPADEFDLLGEQYPTGTYDNSVNNSHWFCVYIKDMNLELTWFRMRHQYQGE